MPTRSNVEVAAQLVLTTGALAQLLGLSAAEVRRRLVDEEGKPVKVRDLPPDGVAWVRFVGARIPGRKDANGHLRFLRFDVDAALEDARLYR